MIIVCDSTGSAGAEIHPGKMINGFIAAVLCDLRDLLRYTHTWYSRNSRLAFERLIHRCGSYLFTYFGIKLRVREGDARTQQDSQFPILRSS